MIATADGALLMVFSPGDPVPVASWMRPAQLPELDEWAALTAGIWLAEVLSWRPSVTVDPEHRQLLVQPQEWHLEAVCASPKPQVQVDPYFFGRDDVEGPSLPPEAVEVARGYCGVCPVRVNCLSWALEHDERFGIWGGTTGRQRTALRRGLARGDLTLREVFAEL